MSGRKSEARDNNDDDDERNNSNLYSLLKLDRDATEEEVHRSYRTLSTTFHPDKLPPSTAQREEIQQIFLDFKKAHDVLIDPVLRLAYDFYGDDGVTLIKRLQMEQREHDARKQAAMELNGEEDDDDDDDVEDAYNLYERLEKLLKSHNFLQAREELRKFMDQHDYHENLSEENQVHLNLSMEFPPVIDLKRALYSGKQYLQYAEKRMRTMPVATDKEREYFRQRLFHERRLVDYQFNKFKDSQQAVVGFTLSSTQPRNATAMTGGTPIAPKWSMAMGASTTLIYPQVAGVMALVGQKEEEQRHPVSMFVNTVYQPIPPTQINLTANLSNDDSHQFIIGSAHTFANQTACRYNITLLSKSPLQTPLIFNFKTYRHLKDIGMATGAISVGGDGEMLQWNVKWEAHQANHKVSANVSMGMLRGNSMEISYRTRFQEYHWMDDYIVMPKKLEVSSVWGRVQKVTAMVTQEFNSLATHPTLGFGMEHDVSQGRWTWIWEFRYNDSTFKVPIPVLHLGSVTNSSDYYSRKLYHAVYCLLFQSMLADFLQDPEMATSGSKKTSVTADVSAELKYRSSAKNKIKTEAENQLKLMEPVAEKKRFLQSQRQLGLVILHATYWYEARREDDTTSEVITMDATKQLQFWVSDGKLSASAIPKSSWLGFYNLQTEASDSTNQSSKWDWRIWRRWKTHSLVTPMDRLAAEPHLTIRYTNSGHVYELTVGETEPFVLPCNDKAECLGDATFVL